MDGALRLALDQAAKQGATRVHSIRLRIGALSGVVPEALRFAFDALAAGTPAAGAALVIEDVPARFWCGACRSEFGAEDFVSLCPHCGQASAELRSGRELELNSLEIE